MSLANVEYQFLYSLIHSGNNDIDFMSELAVVGSLSVEKQLSIYQNNINGAHQKVLAQVYPACLNILGEDYFNQLCYFYRCKYPSTRPDLNMYGEYFSIFLQKRIAIKEELSDFEYLGELAELEWYWHKSYFSDNDPLFDFEKLARISVEKYEKLSFTLSYSFSLHATEYPLIELWNANIQKLTDTQTFLMPDSKKYFCIFREKFKPVIEILNEKQHACLTLISNKASLIELNEAGLQNELMSFIENGRITGFLIDN